MNKVKKNPENCFHWDLYNALSLCGIVHQATNTALANSKLLRRAVVVGSTHHRKLG